MGVSIHLLAYSAYLILRVTEKDIWRLMYWLKHDKEVSMATFCY